MIRRPLYLQRLAAFAGTDLVKIVVGVRRCGKSTLLRQLRNDLVEGGVDAGSIAYIDFELPSNNPLREADAFLAHVIERVGTAERGYLFIDEVQNLEGWEEVVNGLRAEYGLDIYVTGSNARLFAGEGMTCLAGRYVKLEVFPLSLAELCQFRGDDVAQPQARELAYDVLTREGGFPAIALAPTGDLKDALLDGIYDSVFTRDILLRGNIRNEAAFLRVASFVLDNIGNQTSANSIAQSLKAGGHKVSAETVDNYLRLMQKAYLIYRCDRFDIRGKELLRTNGKYYAVDMGLRNRAIGLRGGNAGHVAENLVFLELRRRGADVFVGTLPNAEIDFVVQRGASRAYVQVSDTVADPRTLERELAPFARLSDGYPRVLITKDWADCSQDGVVHLNLYDFLLGKPLPGLDG